jgi:hypothetical protein
MSTFILTFIVFIIATLGLCAGVLMGRKGIQGSCGGLNNIPGLEKACAACDKPCKNKRRNANSTKAES